MAPLELKIELVNQSFSDTVYAFITGRDINRNNDWILVEADGSLYYPTSPSSLLQPLAKDCAILLGSPGSSKTVTVPQIAGARIYFSVDQSLTFLLNPGPALVEPSPTNPSDPNYNIRWHFCEFTFNSTQLFANISYVDFVCLPISLTVRDASGTVQHVPGMESNGLDLVCSGLETQHNQDGAGWNALIIKHEGRPLRVLSPNNGIVLNPKLFEDYWTRYVDESWQRYAKVDLKIDTQASSGEVCGRVEGSEIRFPNSRFAKPSARDIFGCSSGPFVPTGGSETLAIIPRLAAAINRSTLATEANQPSTSKEQYYAHVTTNHYSRIVHEVNLDGRGYAFPYDDVTTGADQAGTLFTPEPALFTIAVGGRGTHLN